MAPSNQVQTSGVLTAGLRTTFVNAFRRKFAGVAERLSNMMGLGLPSDKRTETYAYFLTAPYPVIWNRGTEVSSGTMEDRSFSVTNDKWGRRISWAVEDREDDQTHSLYDQARQLGEHFATLPERVFYQWITGATDADLLPTIPNSADGSALYITTTRYGVSAGNNISGSGVATAGALRTDLFDAAEAFLLFQDAQGEPLFDQSVVDEGLCVTYNVANDRIFREAFTQTRTMQINAGTSTTDTTSAAAVTNIVLESGMNLQLIPTQRISDDDWFIFAKGAPHKPVFMQNRTPIEEKILNPATDAGLASKDEEGLQWRQRAGFGAAEAYGTIRVNN